MKLYPRRFYYQVIAIVSVIIVAEFLAYGFLTIKKQTSSMQSIMEDAVMDTTRNLANSCVRYFLIQDYAGLDELLGKFIEMPGIMRIQVWREDQKVLSEVFRESATSSPERSFTQAKIPIPDPPADMVTVHSDRIIITLPVVSLKVMGWVRVTYSLEKIGEMRCAIWIDTVQAALLGMILTMIILLLIVHPFAKAMRKLADFAKKLGNVKGEQLDIQNGSYEIQQLSQSLNFASANLFAKEQKLSQTEEELRCANLTLEQTVTKRTQELTESLAHVEARERELRTAQRVAHIGSWFLDISSNTLTWSDETYIIFGIDPATPLTLEYFVSFIHLDDRDWVLAAWSKALAGESYSIQHRIVVDGQVKWVHEQAEIHFDKHGIPLTGIGTVQDITERRRNEEALRQSEQRLRAAIDASPVSIVLYDDYQNITYLNPVFTRTFGYTIDDIPTLGDWWPKAYPDPKGQQWIAEKWQARMEQAHAADASSAPLEVRIRCKDGDSRIVQIEAAFLQGQSEQLHLVTFVDVTQQRNALTRLQTLLDTASDGIHILDEGGNVVECSTSFMKMLGYSADEVARLNVVDWDVMISPEMMIGTLRALIRTPATFETQHRRKDGSTFDAEINAKGIELDGRNCLYASSRDISQRKQVEAQLQESREQLKEITDVLANGVMVVDEQSRVTFMNPEAERLLGWRESELAGQNSHELFHHHRPDGSKCERENCSVFHVLRDGVVLRVEQEEFFLCKDGRFIPVSFVAAPILRNGTVQGAVVSFQDISERKAAEARIRHLATIVESSTDAIISETLDGIITSWNKGAEKLLGYTEEETLGQPVSILFPQRQPGKEKGLLAHIARREAVPQYESRRICKNGRVITAAIIISPLLDEHGTVVAASEIMRDISKLKETEERFRALFDDSPDAYLIMEIHEHGRISECNKATEIMLRGPRNKIIGMTPDQLSPERQPDGRFSFEAAAVKIEECMAWGKNNFEWVHQRLDGECFWAHVTISVITIKDRQTLLVAWRDITDRKNSEALLHTTIEESNRLNHLMQGRETQVVELKHSINKLCRKVGQEQPYPAVEEQHIILALTDSSKRKTAPDLKELIDIGLWQRILNSFCDVLGISSAIIDLHGKVLVGARWKRICTDFHRIGKKSLNNCIESDTVLATELSGNKKFAIYTCRNGMTDAASPILINSQHVANVFIGQFLVAPPNCAIFAEQAREFGYNVEDYLKALDEVPILDQAKVQSGLNFMSSFAESVALMALDALHRLETEQLLRQQQTNLISLAEDAELARDAAEAANRVKSEFVANMSHEIRTPLNGIIGLAHLMTKTPLAPKQQDYMSKINASSNSLLQVLNEILDFSKIEAGCLVLEETDFVLNDLLRSLANLFSINAEEKGLELFFEVAPDVPEGLRGDQFRLEQVLCNLTSNAIKFTNQGEIHIAIKVVERVADSLLLDISVRDTGIGITLEDQEKLFQSFSQADTTTTRRFGGTGLGLAICKKIVGLMGGEIDVLSVPEAGSTFRFTVRLQTAQALQVYRDPLHLRWRRVLVADDQAISRQIMQQTLESWSFEVETAEDGEDALAKARQAAASGRPFELFLLDWKMPGMDGLDVAHAIQEEAQKGGLASQPIVIMSTAFGREHIRAAAGTIRLDAILDKPVIPSNLFDVVITIQNNRNPAHDSFAMVDEVRPLQEMARTIWGAKVLLAEDNEVNQQVAQELLEHLGLEVSVANDGLKAVEKAVSDHYDAILMDLHMPYMDGYKATARIRETETGRDLPIIAMTAAAMVQDKEACLAAGMNDHIPKPIDPNQLLATLLKWIKPRPGEIAERPALQIAKPMGSNMPFALPGFDLHTAVKRMTGNWQGLRRALITFASGFAEAKQQLFDLIEGGSIHEASLLIHSLKGAAGNICAVNLHLAAQKFETELKSGKIESWHQFEEHLTTALTSIQHLPEEDNSPDQPVPFDAEQAGRQLRELLANLEEHKLVPDNIIASLRTLLGQSAAAPLVRKLTQEIDNYDYASGIATLRKIVTVINCNLEERHDN
ncbi:MAG: PAS domain S-box protein [Pseudomonadota bacterium]